MKEEKYDNTPTCDECEADFERNIDTIVGEVEDYSRADHRDKKKEVEEAFEERDKE